MENCQVLEPCVLHLPFLKTGTIFASIVGVIRTFVQENLKALSQQLLQ